MQEIVIDYPDNGCFGCSPHNDHGMQLRFRRVSRGKAEAHYTVPEHMQGGPGVVHGGIQAVLLDETMGVAIHQLDDPGDPQVVTVEFHLRYRRPAPVGRALIVCGEVVRHDERDYWVEGTILDADRQLLTAAEARWRKIGTRPRAGGE